jgi:hypothetical protein
VRSFCRLTCVHFLVVLAVAGQHVSAAEDLKVETTRSVWIRGESALLKIALPPSVIATEVEVTCAGHALLKREQVSGGSELAVPTGSLGFGDQTLELRAQTATGVQSATVPLYLVPPIDPHRLEVWLWAMGDGGEFYLDHGFTVAGGPYNAYFKPQDAAYYRRLFDARLKRRAGMMASFSGGMQRYELKGLDPETPDLAYLGAGRNAERFFNPFHPFAEQKRSEINQSMLAVFGSHPALKWAFINTEIVDDLWLDNQNVAGKELVEKALGFTREERGEPKYVATGVLADDDRGYRFHKLVFQRANGIAHANAATAKELKATRPDLQVMTDPFRQVAYSDMFPGLDVLSTWTYTNNDPKLMLYIESLNAAVRSTGQKTLQTVTLLNYPGIIVPKAVTGNGAWGNDDSGWMLMGPDRAKECSWIILSRAPKTIGYYFSSACDPVKFSKPEHQFRVPYATSLALKELSEKVFRPLGPVITRLENAPREAAVLSSQVSRLYNKSPNVTPHYPNEQIYSFYSVLAMTHRQADVLFDEHVEAGELAKYKYLALPKVDVVTAKMQGELLKFIDRGGVVISDQYLGPALPAVTKFDFEFTHRLKVTADAIATGTTYAEWTDQLKPDTAALVKATGVTADEDQKLLDAYAAWLDRELGDRWPAATQVDSPHVLVNELRHGSTRYLAFINDHRGYDARTGPYKAIMEELRPITTRVSVRSETPLLPCDLVRGELLPARFKEGRVEFEIALDDLGGTLIALLPEGVAKVDVASPRTVRRGQAVDVRIALLDAAGKPVSGVLPVAIDIRNPAGDRFATSGPAAAVNGVIVLPFSPGLTDPAGSWTIRVTEGTGRLRGQVEVGVE